MSEINEGTIVVDPMSADLYTCAICYKLLENPKDTKCCRHTFCAQCIGRVIATNPVCPFCREVISASTLSEPSLILKKELAKIQVHCKKHPNCVWEGKNEDLQTHLDKVCEFQLWPCPNCKILDFPACQEKLLRSTIQSHVEECPFEKMKPFFTALAARCNMNAQQTEKSVRSLATNVAKSETTVNDLQNLVEQCHLSTKQSSVFVSKLTNDVDNCNRIIKESTKIQFKESTKIQFSFPLPLTPTISAQHYVCVTASNHTVATSAIVPGCSYIEPENGIIKNSGGERIGAKECMTAVNVIAKLGYSLAHAEWSMSQYGYLLGVRYLMEYTGVEWGGLHSAIEWPPYIQVSGFTEYTNEKRKWVEMAPIVRGFSINTQNALDVVVSLANHSYRVVAVQSAANVDSWIYLLQKCLPSSVSGPLD